MTLVSGRWLWWRIKRRVQCVNNLLKCYVRLSVMQADKSTVWNYWNSGTFYWTWHPDNRHQFKNAPFGAFFVWFSLLFWFLCLVMKSCGADRFYFNQWLQFQPISAPQPQNTKNCDANCDARIKNSAWFGNCYSFFGVDKIRKNSSVNTSIISSGFCASQYLLRIIPTYSESL